MKSHSGQVFGHRFDGGVPGGVGAVGLACRSSQISATQVRRIAPMGPDDRPSGNVTRMLATTWVTRILVRRSTWQPK